MVVTIVLLLMMSSSTAAIMVHTIVVGTGCFGRMLLALAIIIVSRARRCRGRRLHRVGEVRMGGMLGVGRRRHLLNGLLVQVSEQA